MAKLSEEMKRNGMQEQQLKRVYKYPENEWIDPKFDITDERIFNRLTELGLCCFRKVVEWKYDECNKIRYQFFYNKEMKFNFINEN